MVPEQTHERQKTTHGDRLAVRGRIQRPDIRCLTIASGRFHGALSSSGCHVPASLFEVRSVPDVRRSFRRSPNVEPRPLAPHVQCSLQSRAHRFTSRLTATRPQHQPEFRRHAFVSTGASENIAHRFASFRAQPEPAGAR